MAGLQIVRGGQKIGRRKSPGHNRQTQAKELERSKIDYGGNKTSEPIHSKFGKSMRPITTIAEKRRRVELARKGQRNFQ